MSDPDAFELFCAYHLSLTAEDTYRFQNGHQVAQRFSLDLDGLHAALKLHRLDSETLVHCAFDLAAAQADVQLSPVGVDLRTLARMHFDELQGMLDTKRDWDKELED